VIVWLYLATFQVTRIGSTWGEQRMVRLRCNVLRTLFLNRQLRDSFVCKDSSAGNPIDADEAAIHASAIHCKSNCGVR